MVKGKSPLKHPLMHKIFSSSSALKPDITIDRNTLLIPGKNYHVLDADPSQAEVIEYVKAGYDIVVEGPPGTGKSQTITNLIAELMAMDKSILFVSEKMAALEVVKDRLDNIGLGCFCLEIHSHKTKKKVAIDSIGSTLEEIYSSYDDIKEHQFSKLLKLTEKLDQYANALRAPWKNINKPPFFFFNEQERIRKYFKDKEKLIPSIQYNEIKLLTQEKYDEATSQIKEYSEFLKLVTPLQKIPGEIPNQVLFLMLIKKI